MIVLPPKKLVFSGLLVFLSVIIIVPLLGLLSSLLSLKIDRYLLDWIETREVLELSWHTLLMGGTSAIISLAIGVPAGLVLGGRRGKRTFWQLFVFLPLAVPPYLGATCWMALLGSAWAGSFFMSSFVLGISYFPIAVYLVISGMSSIGRHYEEAATLILPEYRVLWKIVLPLLQPYIITAFLLVFLLAATNYAVPALLGYKTLTTKIYTYFALFQNIGGAVFIALPLVLMAFVAVIIFERYLDGKSFFSFDSHHCGSSLSLFNEPKFCWAAFGPAVLLAVIPVIYLLYKAGSFGAVFLSFQQLRGVLLPTVSLALFGSFFLAVAAYLAGYFFERSSFLKNKAIRGLFFISFALPAILLAVGLIMVWNRPLLKWGYDTPVVLILLWGVKFMPLGIRIVADHVKQLPKQLEEAASLGGLRWPAIMENIVWPLSRAGFFAAWGVVYIFSLSELGGTLMVIPPGFDSIPVQLYNMMHYGTSRLVAGTGIIIILISIVPLMLFYFCSRRRGSCNYYGQSFY